MSTSRALTVAICALLLQARRLLRHSRSRLHTATRQVDVRAPLSDLVYRPLPQILGMIHIAEHSTVSILARV